MKLCFYFFPMSYRGFSYNKINILTLQSRLFLYPPSFNFQSSLRPITKPQLLLILMSSTEQKNKYFILSEQIRKLGEQNEQKSEEQSLPKIDSATFIKHSTKESILTNGSKQFFNQNDFKLYAISSKKGHMKIDPDKIKNDAKTIKLVKNPSNKQRSNKYNTSITSKKRQDSRIPLGSSNKIQPDNDEDMDLYTQYLTMEEIQVAKAKHKLQRKIQKFMPKNSSFSQFYGEKVRLMEKQAKRQESLLHKQIFVYKQAEDTDRADKQKTKKTLLKEILQNKTINFRNRRRNRSYQKDRQIPQIKVMKTMLQRQHTRSQIDWINSPTFSESSQLKHRFQFFPEPKSSRFTRFLSPSNTNFHTITPVDSSMNNPQRQSSPPIKYLPTIRNLQYLSQAQTKRSEYLINISIKKQSEFEKTYDQLNDQAVEAIYGFSELKLEEQTSDSFKDQLREMWMKNDINKGKPKKSNPRVLNARKQNTDFI